MSVYDEDGGMEVLNKKKLDHARRKELTRTARPNPTPRPTKTLPNMSAA
jgi:hypothetical protein